MLAASFGAADGGLIAAVPVLIAPLGRVRPRRDEPRPHEPGPRPARSRRTAATVPARCDGLVENPEHFLAPLLLLVLVCQLVAASLVGDEASHLFGTLGLTVAIVFEIVIIFVVRRGDPQAVGGPSTPTAPPCSPRPS